MTETEAANVVEFLVGAYPGTYFSGPTAEVFVNSLSVSTYDIAKAAAIQWSETMDRFPTIAELNGLMRRMREREHEKTHAITPAKPAGAAAAMEAFSSGYRQARAKAGDDNDAIEVKLSALTRRWGAGLDVVKKIEDVASEPAPRAHMGSARQESAP